MPLAVLINQVHTGQAAHQDFDARRLGRGTASASRASTRRGPDASHSCLLRPDFHSVFFTHDTGRAVESAQLRSISDAMRASSHARGACACRRSAQQKAAAAATAPSAGLRPCPCPSLRYLPCRSASSIIVRQPRVVPKLSQSPAAHAGVGIGLRFGGRLRRRFHPRP